MLKIVLIGSSGVGKTSICSRIQTGSTADSFSEIHNPTIGHGCLRHDVTLPGGDTLHLSIWDTAGQERFRSTAPSYYRDASGAVCVYSQTDQGSADAVPQWIDFFKSHAAGTLPIVVAANKQDADDRCVDPAPIKEMCAAQGFLFFEVSAKTGDGVEVMIETLANELIARPEVRQIPLSSRVDVAAEPAKTCGC